MLKVDVILERTILVESGYISFAQLAEKLKTIQKVSFRMALQKKAEQWLLHILIVDVLPEELQRRTSAYHYNYVTIAFFAGTLSGAEMSEWCDIDGKQVIVMSVPTGNSPPYGLHPAKPDFYVRRGATTSRAKQEDIVALIQTKQQEKRYQ